MPAKTPVNRAHAQLTAATLCHPHSSPFQLTFIEQVSQPREDLFSARQQPGLTAVKWESSGHGKYKSAQRPDVEIDLEDRRAGHGNPLLFRQRSKPL
jgi:hypothetical protein